MVDANGQPAGGGASPMHRRAVIGGGMAAAAMIVAPGVAGRTATSLRFRIVETGRGKLRGQVGDGVAQFRGVRYGAPTGGPNRFRPPQPVSAWPGVRDALRPGHQSPQFNEDLPFWNDSSPASEDCLFLNVWAPEAASGSSRLPVMVWLHGGGVSFGSAGAPGYDGASLARAGDVVVVGVNHRLNLFGYTYLGAAGERFAGSGNVGHLDLIAALEWVRDNIAQFGGDPANVTIFGQSGGGGKVSTLLGMPRASGLFHKAIVQSGSLLEFREPSDVAAITHRMTTALGIRAGDVAALQRLPTQALMRYYQTLRQSGSASDANSIRFRPVMDGTTIPDQFWQGGSPRLARHIPMMIGMNLDETIIFTDPSRPPPAMDDRQLAQAAAAMAVITSIDPQRLVPVVAAYRAAMPSLDSRALSVRVSTDVGFWKNAVKQAELKGSDGGAPVFAYECRWKTPCFGSAWAPHGVELPFIFNHPRYGPAWDGKDSEAARAAADPRSDRLRVGAQMMAAWVSFARTGNPSTPALAWQPFDTDGRATMIFDRESRMVNDVRADLRPIVAAL